MIKNSYLKPLCNHQNIQENENYFQNMSPNCTNNINFIVNELYYCNICRPKLNFVQQQTIIFEQLHLTYIILLN